VLTQWADLYRDGQIPSYTQGLDSSYAVYNNVDSVWWFLKALLDYLKIASDA
jgi:glycogen debranching enzyme